MKRKILLFVSAMLCAFAASLVAGGLLTAGNVNDPAVVGLTDDQPTVPTLSDQDRARAVEIASNTAALRKILEPLPLTVSEVGIWHTKDLKPIGAVLRLSLPAPADLEGDWPSILYDQAESGQALYQKQLVPYAVSGVTDLFVLVDLRSGEVVSVSPGPGATVTKPAPSSFAHPSSGD